MAAANSLNQSIVAANRLNFRYSDGTLALRDVNLAVNPGDRLAIVGPNGAGKSTLLLCLIGLLRAEGEIRIGAEELTAGNARRLRRRMALVFQDPDDQLFMPTLREDVAFGPQNLGLSGDEVERRVLSALSQLQLTEKQHQPPHHLSFGEKRRAALATALAMEAEILLLDEPTSNLDPATRHELIEYLRAIPATLIFATHDLDLAGELSNLCLLLSGGEQIALAPTTEILEDDVLLRQHRLKP